MTIPRFWITHKVTKGETLAGVARKYLFMDPGPILAFNAEHLPGAVVSTGQTRATTQGFEAAKTAIEAMGGEADYDSLSTYQPLASNQITDRALYGNDPGQLGGKVVTVADTYPINEPLILFQTPELQIPWTKKALEQYVSLFEAYARSTIQEVNSLLLQDKHDLTKLKHQLLVIDIFAMILTLKVGAIGGVMKSGESLSASNAVVMSGVKLADLIGLAADAVNMPKFDLSRYELPRQIKLNYDLDYFINNTIGWLSPSKWAAAYVGFKEGDPDIVRWGADAISAKRHNEIVGRAKTDLDRQKKNIHWAKKALASSFYNHRVKNGPGPKPELVWKKNLSK